MTAARARILLLLPGPALAESVFGKHALTGLAPIDNGVNDQCGVEERRGRWPQRSWTASVLIFQAILRR